jgi:hypothetical protein
LPLQDAPDLALAPHRIVGAGGLHGFGERAAIAAVADVLGRRDFGSGDYQSRHDLILKLE